MQVVGSYVDSFVFVCDVTELYRHTKEARSSEIQVEVGFMYRSICVNLS